MVKRKKTTVVEYTLLGAKVTGFSAHVDASINHEVRDPRRYVDDAKVYQFDSYLDIEGTSTYPDDRAGDPYHITVYGSEPYSGNFSSTLADFHVRDKDGSPKYRKVRGKEIPVYNVPEGIGSLERQKGTQAWCGRVWVRSQTVTDMLVLLSSHTSPLFIAIHEHKMGRNCWIVGLTLQTTDPAEE